MDTIYLPLQVMLNKTVLHTSAADDLLFHHQILDRKQHSFPETQIVCPTKYFKVHFKRKKKQQNKQIIKEHV